MIHTYGRVISKITKVYFDAGPPIELPVLFSDDCSLIAPLLHYQLTRRRRSLSWHRRIVTAVRLLLEYAAANPALCSEPQLLFQNFIARLNGGTTDAGMDSSGLHWLPRKPPDARSICRAITGFSEYMSKYYASSPLNPMRPANWHERVCRFAGQLHRHDNNFLSHLQSPADIWSQTRYVENSFGGLPQEPRVDGDTRTRFPQERFGDLIYRGFAVRPHVADPILRLNIRDVLITLLLHGGGLRCSEAFHMFINDVAPNPMDETSALIRIGHPSWGQISWKDASGQVTTTNRAEYLVRHGLPRRDVVAGAMHAGWKNPVLDGRYYLQVRWAEPHYGQLFLQLWRLYQYQYLSLPSWPAHPWAWVSFDMGHAGEPLKMGRYIAAHGRAVRRIGLLPKRDNGTKPHCHRHSYAKWLESLGLSREHIRRCLHHASIASQNSYMQLDEGEMHLEMQAGQERLNRQSRPLVLNESTQRDDEVVHSALLKRTTVSTAQPLLDEWNRLFQNRL